MDATGSDVSKLLASGDVADPTKLVSQEASPQAQPPGAAEESGACTENWTSRRTMEVSRYHVAVVRTVLHMFQSGQDDALAVAVIHERHGTDLVSVGLAGPGAPWDVQQIRPRAG